MQKLFISVLLVVSTILFFQYQPTAASVGVLSS